MTNNNFSISKITHEIRNPLTLITSSLQFIEDSHPEVREFLYWKDTMKDLQDLRMLLDDLSAYSHSDTISQAPVNVQELLLSIANSFHPMLKQSKRTLSLYTVQKPPLILGDPIKLKECFINILKNAVEATPENGSIKVALSIDKCQPMLRIAFQDDGCGITPEQMETLFTPFLTHKAGGTGLGLAITKRILDAHKGCITVSSLPGKGSVFTVFLPYIV